MTELYLSYTQRDKSEALEVIQRLRRISYDPIETDSIVDKSKVILILLSRKTKKEELFREIPFLGEQWKYSSRRHLKLMPFFVYHSSKEDPEVTFEDNVMDLYEDIFSGEFKPYAWDLDSDNPEVEFKRVLEDYSE